MMNNAVLQSQPLLEDRLISFIEDITPENEQLLMLSQSSKQLENTFQDCPAVKEVFTLGQNIYSALQLFGHFAETDMIVLFTGDQASFPSQKAAETIEEILEKNFFGSKIEKISHEYCLYYKLQWEQFAFRIAPAVQRSWFKNGYYCIDYHDRKWRYTRDNAILSERLQWCNASLEGRLIPLLQIMRFCQVYNNFAAPPLVSMIDIACDTLQICPTYRYGIERLLLAYHWIDAAELAQLKTFEDYEFIRYLRQRFFGSHFLAD